MVRIFLVQNADEMDDDTFCMHMNKRHSSSLGGLASIEPVAPGTTDAWRSFHDRLHRLRVDLRHEHEVTGQ